MLNVNYYTFGNNFYSNNNNHKILKNFKNRGLYFYAIPKSAYIILLNRQVDFGYEFSNLIKQNPYLKHYKSQVFLLTTPEVIKQNSLFLILSAR